MKISACVTTDNAPAAIAAIDLTGNPEDIKTVIEKVFRPDNGAAVDLKTGSVLIGSIVAGCELIDHVVIGCENDNSISINCHGNPIIVEMIMQALKTAGAKLITVDRMLADRFAADSKNTIETEAKLTQLTAATIEAVKLIANQPSTGLAKTAAQWLDDINLEKIKTQCQTILRASRTARLIINGAKIVIAGPPNSGKSTLLNTLTGKQKSIVTDIPGTTRDWVSATCRTDSLVLNFYDTAGLDESLTTQNAVDAESQKRTVSLLTDCDLVLFVIDASIPAANIDFKTDKKTVLVLNKSDLGIHLSENDADLSFDAAVSVSAKNARGIDDLVSIITQVLNVEDFDLAQSVCFTARQTALIEKLKHIDNPDDAKSAITQLLNAAISL